MVKTSVSTGTTAPTIASTAYAALAQGLSNDEVLAIVKSNHPNGKTTPACIAYYRSQMKTGKVAAQAKPAVKQKLRAAEARKLLLTKLSKMEDDIHELRETIAAA